MRTGFYLKLAREGIRKNKRLYFPYILTGAVMVMMYYILSFLMETPAVEGMKGGSILMTVLPLGCGVIGIFSFLFLFYTNSFLVRQRYREFGLYNMLGMDKQNISRIMFWESIYTLLIVITAGLGCGIAFSKAAELILLNLLNMEVDFSFRIGVISLKNTVLVFAGIYLVLLLYSLLKVRLSKPLELMLSNRVGEKVPKFAGVSGLAGIALLVWAYYLAVNIDEPVTALFLFFVAVVMVIAGTYLVFVSASVAFCRLLQKNKKYYYKPNHFVSVASMVYRMKRNGAGLASICILLTMVLVMLSSTTTLYAGEEGAARNRYPSSVNIKLDYDAIDCISDEKLTVLQKEIEQYAPKDADLMGTRYGIVPGVFTDSGVIIDYHNVTDMSVLDYDNLGYLYILSLEDYNRMMHEKKTLAADECFLYCDRLTTQWQTFTMEYGNTYQVKERLTAFREDGDALAMAMPSVYLVVNDIYSFAEPVFGLKNNTGASMMEYEWICGIDYATTEEEIQARADIYEVVKAHALEEKQVRMFYVLSREEEKQGFFELYGDLFFLGIMLSIVFLLATVLIIYYKQISEGYEDRSRFEIMQKVGMTKRDIKKSINSQMLTVFFLPLVLAGIHLAFAFPFLSKIMLMFAFDDTILNVMVTLACFVIFGLVYTAVYKLTSGFYYAIVSGKE